jgi:hypothetical protein
LGFGSDTGCAEAAFYAKGAMPPSRTPPIRLSFLTRTDSPSVRVQGVRSDAHVVTSHEIYQSRIRRCRALLADNSPKPCRARLSGRGLTPPPHRPRIRDGWRHPDKGVGNDVHAAISGESSRTHPLPPPDAREGDIFCGAAHHTGLNTNDGKALKWRWRVFEKTSKRQTGMQSLHRQGGPPPFDKGGCWK